MKRIFAAAALTTMASVASAQTSVSIYGVADLYYRHDSGDVPGGSKNALDSGGAQLAGTRLGFRGKEDLGGGLAAIFTAEMGFTMDTGAFDGTGIGFGRQAFVGLQGNFGTVKFGRQYNPLFMGGYKYDPFGDAMVGAYSRLIVLGAGKRLNNSIVYGTPTNLGGFSGEASYSFGEVPGAASQGRVLGLTVGYANGPFSTNLIYNNANNIPTAGNPAVNTKNTGVGASYDMKVATVSGLIQRNKSDAAAPLDTQDYLVGVKVPFGANALLASYIRHKNKAIANADTDQIAFGYTHALSKRTTLYTSVSRVSNDAAASLQTPGFPGGSVKSFNVGINHSF